MEDSAPDYILEKCNFEKYHCDTLPQVPEGVVLSRGPVVFLVRSPHALYPLLLPHCWPWCFQVPEIVQQKCTITFPAAGLSMLGIDQCEQQGWCEVNSCAFLAWVGWRNVCSISFVILPINCAHRGCCSENQWSCSYHIYNRAGSLVFSDNSFWLTKSSICLNLFAVNFKDGHFPLLSN